MSTPAPSPHPEAPHPVPRPGTDGPAPFTVLIAGPAHGGVARLVGAAVAGALPGGWLGRTVVVRVAAPPGAVLPATVRAAVDEALSGAGLEPAPESHLGPATVADADLVLTTDAAVHAAIEGWPTAAYSGEPEPPEVFGAYETRVLGGGGLRPGLREERSLTELATGATAEEIDLRLGEIGRPAHFVANVARAVVTNHGPTSAREA